MGVRVRRRPTGYALIAVLAIVASAGALGFAAMMMEREPIAAVPGALMVAAGSGLIALTRQKVWLQTSQLVIRSFWRTRQIALDQIVDVKAPPSHVIGWPIGVRLGYFSLVAADHREAVVFYSLFQRTTDLDALRSALKRIAEENRSRGISGPATATIRPSLKNVLIMVTIGLASFAGGAAMLPTDYYRAGLLGIAGITFTTMTWILTTKGKAGIDEGHVWWRTAWGNIERTTLSDVQAVDVAHNQLLLRNGKRIRIHHGLNARGATERFLEEVSRRIRSSS